MESGPVPARTIRRHKDWSPAGPGSNSQHDDEISRLIIRARLLRDRMEQAMISVDIPPAATGDRAHHLPGPSTVLELNVLRNVSPDHDIDTDVLFANLFFNQQGADA